MDSFKHEVLGDVSDETRWLKFFTTRDLIFLVVGGGVFLLMLNIFPQTAFFIVSEVFLLLGVFMRVLLGLVKRNKENYLKAGGVSYYDYYARKKHHKKKKAVYSLGTEEM